MPEIKTVERRRFRAKIELKIEFDVEVPDEASGYPTAHRLAAEVQAAAVRAALDVPGIAGVSPCVVDLRNR